MIIGITGTLAAGKGTIVDILKQRNFKHYSVRDYLIKIIEEKKIPVNRDSMVQVANELREKYGSEYIIKQLYLSAKNESNNSVIESIRTLGEVNFLKNQKDFYLFAIDADKKIRYERAIERKSQTDKISYEEFLDNEKREWDNPDPTKQNIKKCMELSDYKFFNNESIEKLSEKINKTLKQII